MELFLHLLMFAEVKVWRTEGWEDEVDSRDDALVYTVDGAMEGLWYFGTTDEESRSNGN